MCKYSIEKANDELEISELLLKNKKLSKSLNSSYYGIFHATRGLLITDGLQRRKHSGLISEFIKSYIAAGKIDKKYSKIIKTAEKIRIESDYKFFYIVSREETEEQLKNARDFVAEITNYLEKKVGITFNPPSSYPGLELAD
ncbi:MAG TPA: HEPN domain-containing protein [Candidatus Deferrimicrobium sp.]|nr:HEPN domain-containing protein [Candidatus Deferrimicrobium sp.]